MPLLEESAIKCLGLFACFDKDVAKEYLQILVLLAENETNHVLTSTQEVAVNFRIQNFQKFSFVPLKIKIKILKSLY